MRLLLLAFISLFVLSITIPKIASSTPKTMNPNSAQSISDLRSQRDSLQRVADAREGEAGWWHNAVLGTAFAASAIGLLAFICQNIETRRTTALSTANKSIGALTERITALQIEQEKTARVQLLKEIAYRTLNVGELADLRRATYAYRAVPLDIFYVSTGDPEAREFAARINAAFDIWKPNLFAINDAGQPGLSVEFNPNNPQATEAAQRFFEALNHHGFRVNGPFSSLPYIPKDLPTDAVPRANLRLIVGQRAPVYLTPELRK